MTSAGGHRALAYKVLTADQWAQFQRDGVFKGAPVDLADGYIHLSTAEQLGETIAKHFAGQEGLIVAEVDLAAVGGSVKWEPSREGALFPHVYAVLPMCAVVASAPLVQASDGAVILPSAK
ncbi:MAG TPA: DUF952 domain-containing protein [Novosphingobium sp.]|nr:DUF952 domain-containing protein [Novosphingobium sp.]